MHSIRHTIKSYYYSVKNGDEFNDVARKIPVINLFSFVGMAITGVLSISAYSKGDTVLGSVLIFASLVYFLGYYIQKTQNNFAVSSSIIICSLYLLMFYLVYSGGIENTGPLWIFMVAPVSLFLHGLKRGLLELSQFICILIIIMYLPPELASLSASYSAEFKTRLIYSFLTVVFLSSVYEYSRQDSYQTAAKLTKKYERLAKLDPLTKLSNRRDAMERITVEKNRLARNNQELALIICDIDHFKQINDKFGHKAGDQALVSLSELFSNSIRQQDCVARWGGEEFLFVLPQTNLSHALSFCEKLHHAIKNLYIEDNGEIISLSVSLGVSTLTASTCINDAINQADKYLYMAKNAGRNQTFPK